MRAVRQVAYRRAFLATGLASSHEKGRAHEVQGVLPEATSRKTHGLYGKERAEFHRGCCKTNQVPGVRADLAANAVPSELIKRQVRFQETTDLRAMPRGRQAPHGWLEKKAPRVSRLSWNMPGMFSGASIRLLLHWRHG